jgi:hypothetical protein
MMAKEDINSANGCEWRDVNVRIVRFTSPSEMTYVRRIGRSSPFVNIYAGRIG